jgi:hypothetical protein
MLLPSLLLYYVQSLAQRAFPPNLPDAFLTGPVVAARQLYFILYCA